MLDGFRRWFSSSKQSASFRSIVSFFTGRPKWSEQQFAHLAKDGYTRNAYVYTIVSRTAMACAGIPLTLYKKRRSHQSQVEQHPILDLMKRPNPWQGHARFVENEISYLLLAGNSYTEKVGPTSGENAGRPRELYSLRPDRMVVVVGDAKTYVRGYEYRAGAQDPTKYDAEEILHMKFFHPLDDFYGLGPLQAAARSVDQNNESRAYNVGLLQNFARPSGAFVSKHDLGPDGYERLKAQVDELAGPTRAGRPLILESDMDWKEMGLSPVDMSWLESTRMSAAEIAIVFGMPPEMIGLQQSKTFSNYSEARRSWYEETILPIMDWRMSEYNHWLVQPWEDGLVLDYDRDQIEALRDDRKMIYDMAAGGYNAGLLKRNEARVLIGYDEDPDGDVFKAPAATPFGGAAPHAFPPNPNQLTEKEPTDARETTDQAAKSVEPPSDYIALPAFSKASEEQKAAHWKAVDAQRTRWARTVKTTVAKQFDRERKAVVSAIRDASGKSDAIDACKSAVKDGADSWRRALKASFMTVARPFGQRTIADLRQKSATHVAVKAGKGRNASRRILRFLAKSDDEAMDMWSQLVSAYYDQYGASKVQGIGETTLDQIRSELDAGTAAGESMDQVADRIDNLYLDEIIPNRSEVIARTESAGAANTGSYIGAKSTGIDLTHSWLSTRDDRTRDDHAAAEDDNGAIPLDQPFTVGDSKLLYPGDGSLGADPAEVIQCRCAETYAPTEGEE